MDTRMMRFLRVPFDNWTERHALQWAWNILVLIHVGLGVAVLAGGAERFSFPTYQPLTDLVDGRTWIWGVWILAAALLMSVPNRWVQVAGLWAAMCWNIMWATLFSVAVVDYPTAGATAAVAHGGFAMLDAALLTARITNREAG